MYGEYAIYWYFTIIRETSVNHLHLACYVWTWYAHNNCTDIKKLFKTAIFIFFCTIYNNSCLFNIIEKWIWIMIIYYLELSELSNLREKGEMNYLSKSWRVEIIYNLYRISLAKQSAITGCWQYSPIFYLLNKYNLHNFLTPVSKGKHIVNNINVVEK